MDSARQALADALVAPRPEGMLEGSVTTRLSGVIVHSGPVCATRPDEVLPWPRLMGLVDRTDEEVLLCLECVGEFVRRPHSDRDRWFAEVASLRSAYTDVNKARMYERTVANAPANFSGILAHAAYGYSSFPEYLNGTSGQGVRVEYLRDAHKGAWEIGKEVFDKTAAQGSATAELASRGVEPVPRWAVVRKGRVPLSERSESEMGRLVHCALMEGPRFAQSPSWYLTVATWGDEYADAQLLKPLSMAPRPDVSPETLALALDLWDDDPSVSLDDVVTAAAHATR